MINYKSQITNPMVKEIVLVIGNLVLGIVCNLCIGICCLIYT